MAESMVPHESRRLAEFIRENATGIISEWADRARRIHPAQRLDRPVLLDHMPQFLQDLCDYVGEIRAGHQAAPSNKYPRIHALERLDLGFDVGEVVKEYQLLREVLAELIVTRLAPALRSAQMPRLHSAIDLAVAESVRQYMAARERTLHALNRISEAALDQADVAAFLGKLIEVLSETAPSVDIVKVMLREDRNLVVQAAVGLESRTSRISIGQGFSGRIAATRQPAELAVTDATRPEVQSEALLARNPRVLYGIPLLHRGDLVGVALMGSTTAYQFSDEDKLLFRTMANRATAIIVQGQLLERERAARAHAEELQVSLRASVAFRDRMMGVLGHDLRNPLSVIRTSAQLLARNTSLAAAQGRSVERVLSSVDRIDRMIRDLLDYTRARSGFAIHRTPAVMADLCREVIDEMQTLHPQRVFKLSVTGDTAGEWDRDRIVRLLSNLVTNAVHYGCAKSEITIAALGAGDTVEVSVHNTGNPIPPQIQPRLFEEFTRAVDPAAGHEGLGLGLFIVNGIAHAHGGTASVVSTAESGTTFTARLPRSA